MYSSMTVTGPQHGVGNNAARRSSQDEEEFFIIRAGGEKAPLRECQCLGIQQRLVEYRGSHAVPC